MKYSWKLVSVEVKKDMTQRIYEDDETRHVKVITEFYVYSQYNSRLDRTVIFIKDADGNVIKE